MGEHDGPAAPDGSGGSAGQGWTGWQAALVDTLLTLADGESAVVVAGDEHRRLARPGGRTGLRLLVPGRKRPSAPTLRLTRTEDHVRGTFSGAEQHGGPFPWTGEEVEAILALGWHRPSVGDGTDFVRFWPDDVPQGPYLPLDEARRVADVAARTLRGLMPPADGADDVPPVLARDAG